ncbi:MAG: hypothetical protein RL341_791 [Pseudomonadota bacterium]
MKRRTFLAVGTGSAALLAAGGWWWSTQHAAPKRAALATPDAAALLTALVPAVVGAPGGPLTAPQIAAAVERVKGAIASLPLPVQDEIGELFGLLSNSVFRRLAAGIAVPWREAKPEELAAFLQSWRTHSLGLLQVGYHALHDLIVGSYYADESTWAHTGYPGPIKLPA